MYCFCSICFPPIRLQDCTNQVSFCFSFFFSFFRCQAQKNRKVLTFFFLFELEKFNSGGVAGNALEQATAICMTPFTGIDLKEVTRSELENLNTFFETAEQTELNFFVPAVSNSLLFSVHNFLTDNFDPELIARQSYWSW